MPDLSLSFVASIARALNSARVPCVLWGQYLLNIHGVPSIIDSIDFVIPDDRLHVSIKTLFKIGTLSPCLRGGLCPSSPQQRYSPPPAFHIHIDDSEVTVDLYPQSETLWFLPPLDGSLSSPQEAKLPLYLVLASDQTILPQRRPGRGSGVLSTEYPVLLPRALVLLEAFLRLYARDVGTRIGSFAMAMIGYMEEYVDDDGLLDGDHLSEPLRTFYRELREGEKPVGQWTDELKDALRRDNESCRITNNSTPQLCNHALRDGTPSIPDSIFKDTRVRTTRIRLNSTSSHNNDSITLTLSSEQSLENLRSIREARKSSETAFFDRRPRIADQASTRLTPIRIRRWELAAEALQTYPILQDQSFILHSHPPPPPQISIDEEDISNQVCIHSQPTELLKPYIQNWPYDDLLRNVGGLTVGMILWLSNFIYGGLHAAAQNEHFSTTAEKWLWRASCSYISFAGGLWIILNWAAAAYPPLNEFWERWMDGAKGRIQSIFLGFVVFVCGLSFSAARVYLVLEAFISIRDLPRKAYDTLDWTQMVPHF